MKAVKSSISKPGADVIAQAVRRANIVYDLNEFQSGHEYIPPYLANGWIGGCFDEFGFLSKPNFDYDHGRRQFSYVNHYYRYGNGGHNQCALLFMTAQRADGRELWIGDLTAYRQELDLYAMTLTTAWRFGPSSYKVSSFCSQAQCRLFQMDFDCRPQRPEDMLSVRVAFDTLKAENNSVRHKELLMDRLDVQIQKERNGFEISSQTNCRTTITKVTTIGAVAEQDGTDLKIRVPAGKSSLRILVLDHELSADDRKRTLLALPGTSPHFRREHVAAASKFWAASGVFLPEGPAQKVWTRSAYYLASAVAPKPTHIMVPTGLNNNIWRHGFPQDMYYVVENLPRLGHIDRALAQMPYWLDNLQACVRYTKRIAERNGALYPWIPPYENWDEFEVNGPTNPDSFEFHNSAYVAAMVWNLFRISADKDFLAKHFPIIEEVARLYLDITSIDAAGKAVISHPNMRMQDESSESGGAKTNALCSIWSALFTFRAYVDACGELGRAGELTPRINDVLQSGYDLQELVRTDGTMRLYKEDHRPPGRQKHPSQLNPITYLPLPDFADGFPAVKRSWEQRYDLIHGARRPESPGWTFAQFTLASARSRSGKDVAHDLAMVQPARYADPYWIQFYESSMREPWHMKKAYYFTANGLYLQALTDCVMQYWRGVLDLFAALMPEWMHQSFFFHGLRTDGGLVVSGRWRKGAFDVEIIPTRDVEMPIRVSLRKIRSKLRDADGRTMDLRPEKETPWSFRKGCTVTIRSHP